jgi:hypothetical protein
MTIGISGADSARNTSTIAAQGIKDERLDTEMNTA